MRGVVSSVGGLLKSGVTHLGVATDYVIESFRNDLWPGYKTGAGIPADLWSQFRLLEEAMSALGVTVWPMVEFEADDALASAAEIAARDERVTRVVICTPDKDLAQCVRGTRVVQMDRRSASRVTKRASWRSLACRRLSSPTTLRWSATRRMATPACEAGGRKPRRACCGSTGRSKAFPRSAWGKSEIVCFSFDSWRGSDATCRSSNRSNARMARHPSGICGARLAV